MRFEELKIEVDRWLEGYFSGKGTYNKRIYESMEYSLSVGGKRIRPILMLLTYSLYKEDYNRIIPIAGAMEMIHTYSLIHDDLPCMDNDDLRRGMQTNHIKFGYPIAVLAGDGLLNEAMNIMFEFCINNGPESINACNIISHAAGADGMIGGQVVDILDEGKSISKEELHYMHSNKTGALIKASILSGAILGNAEKKHLDILESFGEKLGLVFQIKDDILDVEGNTEIMGKKVKSDENNNKTTFVTIYGINQCRKMCSELTEECMQLLSNLNMDVSSLKELTEFLLDRQF